jgi:hypothetical protein
LSYKPLKASLYTTQFSGGKNYRRFVRIHAFLLRIKDNFINAEKSILVIGRIDDFGTVHCIDIVRLKLMGKVSVTAFCNGVKG